MERLLLPQAMRPDFGNDGVPCEVVVIQEMEYIDGKTLHDLMVEVSNMCGAGRPVPTAGTFHIPHSKV